MGIVFVDGLQKMLFRCRPYERGKGQTERIYYKYLGRMQEYIVKNLDLYDLARQAGAEFASIERNADERPVIGVVGEIYLRNNRFSNNHLITKLEALGAEVRLASFAEWVNYTSYTFQLDARYHHRWRSWVESALQRMYQNRVEHRVESRFGEKFPIPHETPVDKVIKLAEPYLPVAVRGEAVLSIGKAIDLAHEGIGGIVNSMPFNCMPGTIVSSLSRKVSSDLGNLPWLNISYEGLKDSGEETRIEAFVDQVRGRGRGQVRQGTKKII